MLSPVLLSTNKKAGAVHEDRPDSNAVQSFIPEQSAVRSNNLRS